VSLDAPGLAAHTENDSMGYQAMLLFSGVVYLQWQNVDADFRSSVTNPFVVCLSPDPFQMRWRQPTGVVPRWRTAIVALYTTATQYTTGRFVAGYDNTSCTPIAIT